MAKKEKKPNIILLGDRILVKPTDDKKEEKKTASGIIIPVGEEGKNEPPESGIAIVVGEGKREDGAIVPMRVKAGDTVMFPRYGYDEVKVEGGDYFIVNESNVLAIIPVC